MRSVDTIVYSYDDLVKFCQANEIELKKTTKEEKRSVWKKPFFRTDRLENFFTPVDCLDFSIENKLCSKPTGSLLLRLFKNSGRFGKPSSVQIIMESGNLSSE